MIEICQGEIQVYSLLILLNVKLISSSKYRGGERLGKPILSLLYYFLFCPFICQSFGLSYSFTVYELSWLTYPKEKFKLRKHLAYCMFLLNSGRWKVWTLPFFPPSKIFWSFYWLVSLSVYVTLPLYLNTYEWPIPKRELSFQTKHFICTATLWGGERLGRPILPPPPTPKCSDRSIYRSVFQYMLFFCCIWRLMNDLFQRDN